ncbi:uncharacterized protein NPIL_621411 [Nephila pilipes]|uniref:Uncharacterized protein n=1 Tax=Nephila pilipes TaxID=299642 RepID=A0A8X6P0T0_NEPPI|nr:uncharacterized protein NPIL_621411 [Nephila pilipes]
MEPLPRIVQGCPQKDAIEIPFSERPSVNCNICRNFKNIHDRSHRMSKVHQKKLSERLGIIRAKMKMIKLDSIVVHDVEWGGNEELYCYFCDEPVRKHHNFQGLTVECLGYLTHLADACHMKAVKSYLKYHGRKEKFELFCKTKVELEKFLNKIPEAEKKYLAKLNYLNKKDVNQIKEIELQRQKLVNEAVSLQCSKNIDSNVIERPSQELLSQKISKPLHSSEQKKIGNFNKKTKVPPWLISSEEKSHVQQTSDKPVIGPTIDTLMKHVSDLKEKGLPAKRLKPNFNRR